MGPRSFERGNATRPDGDAWPHAGFNGAALVRARKCRDAERATSTMASSFNGAALVRAAEMVGRYADRCGRRRFNGAALVRARKCRRRRRRDRERASMGPRSFERGNRPMRLDARTGSFNGAALVRAAEMLDRTAASTAERLACFNGAALVRAAEIVRATRRRRTVGTSLQWGRARSSAEMSHDRMHAIDAARRLQWGRARSSRGNARSLARAHRRARRSFNGAALVRAAEMRRDCRNARRVDARLQWGRGSFEPRKSRDGTDARATAEQSLQWGRGSFEPRKSGRSASRR